MRQSDWILLSLAAVLSVSCARAQLAATPTPPPAASEIAPIIHAVAAPTRTWTTTAAPTGTLTAPPSTHSAATAAPTWTATLTALASLPTDATGSTPTHIRSTIAPTSTQLASTSTPQTLMRTIQITGELGALQRDGKGRWEAIGIECLDARGQAIARLPVLAWQGVYALPLDTRQVRLWIGAELGGETWWREWDVQLASAASDPIILRIGALAPAPQTTSAPTAAPTAIPTAVPTYTPG